MSNRHLARTIAMQSLFLWDFNGANIANLESTVKQVFKNFAPQFDDHGFVENVIKGVINNQEDIDAYISRYANRMAIGANYYC
jgi:transcription termination factor NusB